MQSLIRNHGLDTIKGFKRYQDHPFVTINKRTSITAAGLFLAQNGVQLTVTNQELGAFTLSMVTASLEIEAIATWLEANSRS